MMVLRLASRNVWRNPRRTWLTVAATVFAVFLVIVFVAMSDGSHSKLIEDSVRIQAGHVQLAGKGYLENQTLEYSMHWTPELEALVRQAPGVQAWAPRVSSAALLSMQDSTQGVALIGVDPVQERRLSTLADRLVKGEFLPSQVRLPLVLGEQLAENLGVDIGAEVLVFSQAYTLQNAYELFNVVGILRLPDPELERSFALVRLDDLQRFLEFGDRVTEVALLANNAKQVPVIEDFFSRMGMEEKGIEVNRWDEVMPDLAQYIVIDDAGNYIVLGILVVVVAFGILNTILMSVMERQQEFGVMLALGLRPSRIFQMVFVESLLLAGIGLLLGLGLALPVVGYFIGHPIPIGGEGMEAAAAMVGMEPVLAFELRSTTLPGAALMIAIVATLAALYPAVKASRARPADALRSV